MPRLQDRSRSSPGVPRASALATVRLFLDEGAKVLFTDVDADRGHGAEAELANENALFEVQDVRQEADWAHVVATAGEWFGGIDVLFNNAGIYHIASLTETTLQSGSSSSPST